MKQRNPVATSAVGMAGAAAMSIVTMRARRYKRHARGLFDRFGVRLGFLFRRRIRPALEEAVAHPAVLHVEGTNVCNARCSFCAYGKVEIPKRIMPMALFRRAIEQFVAIGGVRVSLTPVVGDPLVDPFLFERLDVLHAHREIDQVSFHTNGIALNPGIQRRLFHYDRLKITISWGGFDRASYQRIMGVDRFETVRRNVFAMAAAVVESRPPLRLVVGVRGAQESRKGPVWDELRCWERRGALQLTYVDEYDSWGGVVVPADVPDCTLRPVGEMRGACQRLLGSPLVLADGRVNACPCRDVQAKLVVGDLTRTTLGEVCRGSEMAALLDRQERGDYPDVCRACSYYVSVYDVRRGLLRTWRDRF